MGLGHLVRCQSLAEMIKNKYRISFYCRLIPEAIQKNLVESGFQIKIIREEKEFFDTLQAGDGVVIDGYSFGPVYYKDVRDKGCKLIVIDDLHREKFCADLIINPSPGVSSDHYDMESDCSALQLFALGPKYALLRPAFLTSELKRTIYKEPAHLFICFGGSDTKNLTEKVLRYALDFKQFGKITIITGSGYLHHHELEGRYSHDENVRFFHAVNDQFMAEKLAEADVAVVPSSGMLYEALSMQVKVISGMYVDNQKNMYEGFKRMNAFIDAGTFDEEMLMAAFTRVKSFKPETIIDRKSPERYRAQFETVMK